MDAKRERIDMVIPNEPFRSWASNPRRSGAALSRMHVACLECGKRFSVSTRNADPSCPRCHGVDIDVA